MPPFSLELDSGSDHKLAQQLRRSTLFPYLSPETRKELDQLRLWRPSTKFLHRHTGLLKLWPMILTDALKGLKEKSNKECAGVPDNKRAAYVNEFFHRESLGVKELEDVLKRFADFEGLLYGASPERYRDHVTHAFRVWLVGAKILREALDNSLDANPSRETPLDLKPAYEIGPVEWQCMWAITALCHDIGYPLQAIRDINQRARNTFEALGLIPVGDLRFAFSQQMQPFHDNMIKLMASKPVTWSSNSSNNRQARSRPDVKMAYLTHLQNKYYLKFLKSFDRLEHGIVSALLLSRCLVYFLESDYSNDLLDPLDTEDARQFVIHREILRAIAGHTCGEIYHIKFNTLGFLLYLVDELQGWGRPTFDEIRHDIDEKNFRVNIRQFSLQEIEVAVWTGDMSWTPKAKKRIWDTLDRLRKRLRLAVDSPALCELTLSYSVRQDDNRGHHLHLRKGKLALSKNLRGL